jgi:glycine betaine/proline transport system ATP-binding protein
MARTRGQAETGAFGRPAPKDAQGRTDKIEVRDVTKIFGKEPLDDTLKMLRAGRSKDQILRETGHVVGLDRVSFSVTEGEVFVVMGLSGSGKSTLIRCLNRLIEPSSGQVLVDGDDVTAASESELRQIRRTKMSMVFQNFGLLPHKTVLDNVAYGLKVQGIPEKERLVRAAESLDLVGLTDWGTRKPANLSGGMQQRVGLARALCTDPDILLMDEAFSALDPLIRRQMQDELLQLQARVHKTIVFITHDLNEALRVGNRVAIMQDGVVVQIGTPEEIILHPATQYVADFIQDVDQGRVLTVDAVQHNPVVFTPGEMTASEALKRALAANTGGVFLVGPRGRAEALVMNEDLARLNGSNDLAAVAQTDFPTIPAGRTLAEAYALCASGRPVAVTGDDGLLVGAVRPLDVLDTLGEVERLAETTDFDTKPPENHRPAAEAR